jgi:precorrin-6A/cobalt-precorrin-6A reductase
MNGVMTDPHILILGGTGEARRLAERLAAFGQSRLTLSLAGRTATPLPQACAVRSGGFGGADGLAAYLREHGVDILVDASHPFAARISQNAVAAARQTGVPLIRLERPAWQPVSGDRWIEAGNITEAAKLLGETPRVVFLSIGRQELAPFHAHPQHAYIVRSVDPVPPDAALPRARYLLDRGPFIEEAERALLSENGIEVVVAKNSGGEATYAKIAAARALEIPVIMVRRPMATPTDAATTVEEALEKLRHAAATLAERGE